MKQPTDAIKVVYRNGKAMQVLFTAPVHAQNWATQQRARQVAVVTHGRVAYVLAGLPS